MRLYLLLTFILCSCQNRTIKNDLSTINFQNDNKVKINIEKDPLNSYAEKIERKDEKTKVKKRIIAVKLMPALYNSFLYVQLIKKLNKENMDITVIESNGFTSVIAALYANSETVSEFEWKIFKLYKALEGLKTFYGKWQTAVIEFVKKEFQNKKLYQLNKLLLIPRIAKNKAIYNHDLKVSEAISLELQDKTRKTFYINPVFDFSSMKQVSHCDYCFNLSVNSKNIKLLNYSSDQLGAFSKITGLVFKNKEKIFILDQVVSEMDKLNGLEIFYNQYDEKIDKLIDEIKIKNNI